VRASLCARTGGGGKAAPPFTTRTGEWPSYTGDTRGSRYSPLDQISTRNFSTRKFVAIQDGFTRSPTGVQLEARR